MVRKISFAIYKLEQKLNEWVFSKIDAALLGGGAVIVGVISLILFLITNGNSVFGTIATVCMVTVLVMIFYMQCENKKNQYIMNQQAKTALAEYENRAKELSVVKSHNIVTLLDEHDSGLADGTSYYIWIEDQYLKLFPTENHASLQELTVSNIPLSDIRYFSKHGEIAYSTKITGGGTSLKGAIWGSIIAGDVGGVIGSRVPIKSEEIIHDNQKTELIYQIDGEVVVCDFASSDYDIFKELLPKKEYRYISISNQNNDDIERRLETLENLYRKKSLQRVNMMERKKKF